MVRSRLTDDELKEKLGQSTRTTNCENILLKATNLLMFPESKLQDNSTSIIKTVMYSVALLRHTNCELVQRRGDLNNQFHQVYGEHVEFTELLSGNNLPKQVQDISVANMSNQYQQNNHRTGGISLCNFWQGPRWRKPPLRKKIFCKESQKQA